MYCSKPAATVNRARQRGEADCQPCFRSLIQHKSHTKNICLRSKHMCHILLSGENNRRSIKTSEKREHGGVSPVWAAAGSYLNQLMCTRVPAPTTTNQVLQLHSQIKYLFSFSSSLSFESFTPSFVLRTQGVNSIRRPRRDEWNGIKRKERFERAFAHSILTGDDLVQQLDPELRIFSFRTDLFETNWDKLFKPRIEGNTMTRIQYYRMCSAATLITAPKKNSR